MLKWQSGTGSLSRRGESWSNLDTLTVTSGAKSRTVPVVLLFHSISDTITCFIGVDGSDNYTFWSTSQATFVNTTAEEIAEKCVQYFWLALNPLKRGTVFLVLTNTALMRYQQLVQLKPTSGQQYVPVLMSSLNGWCRRCWPCHDLSVCERNRRPRGSSSWCGHGLRFEHGCCSGAGGVFHDCLSRNHCAFSSVKNHLYSTVLY